MVDSIERVLPPSGGIAGIPQPVFGSGSATAPPAASLLPTFTPIFPPPLVGDAIGIVGPVVTGDLIGPPPPPFPPTFQTGSATAPTAASWIPQFTTTFPSPTVTVNTAQDTNTPIWVPPPEPPQMITTTQNVT